MSVLNIELYNVLFRTHGLRFTAGIMRRWRQLTRPYSTTRIPDERRQAWFLASLFLTMGIVVIVVLPLRYLTDAASPYTPLRIAAALMSGGFLLFCYHLSRAGRFRLAVALAIIFGSLIILIMAPLTGAEIGTRMLHYLFALTLFASLFLDIWVAVVVAVAHAAGMLLLPHFAPALSASAIIEGPLAFNFIMTLWVVIYGVYRVRLEAARRAELTRSEARYRAVSDLISDYAYYYRVEPDGTQVREWITDSFERFTGYTAEEITTATAHLLFHPDDLDRMVADRERTLSGQGVVSEYRFITKSGEHGWMQLYRQPVKDPSGRVIGYYGAARDITAHKNEESQRLRLTVQREWLDLMGRFVQAISHDFRTSLATIETGRYVIERLLDGQAEEGGNKIRQKLATIHHSVEHMTEQLQNLYRVTALADLKLTPYDLNEIVEAVLAKLYPRAEQKGQTITFEPDKTLLLIHADVNELRGAVDHLLANAINYTPENGHITVRTGRHDHQAVVEVRDNGIGIPADQLPQIFDFFYRGDVARGLHSGGVGLGLSIVRLVAEAHGGTIQAASQPGAGSVFTLSLPLAKMSAHASATVA